MLRSARLALLVALIVCRLWQHGHAQTANTDSGNMDGARLQQLIDNAPKFKSGKHQPNKANTIIGEPIGPIRGTSAAAWVNEYHDKYPTP